MNLLQMKGKRKLLIDKDDQFFSPSMLLYSNSETEQSEDQLRVRFSNPQRPQLPNSYLAQSANRYLIEVKEPYLPKQPKERRRQPSIGPLLQFNQKSYNQHPEQLQSREGSSKLKSITQQQERAMERQITKIRKAARTRSASKKSCKFFFENNNILEGMVKAQKVKNITRNFVKKVRRSSLHFAPVQYDKLKLLHEGGILFMKGLELPRLADMLMSLLSVLQIILLLVIYTLSIVFSELMSDNEVLSGLQRLSVAFYLLEMALNFVTVKFEAGKKLDIFKEIIEYYISNDFAVDFISLVILLVDISSNLTFVAYFRLFILCKLPQCSSKIEKLEVYLVRNLYHQQYWQLVKVFLVNFGYAHVIALILILMSRFDPRQNWVAAKGLQGSNWLEVYVWSFYWATNMMLTVGFGDIVPVNCGEAIVVIFIQTFSCIIMAYNISRVGTILSNIRSEDLGRSRKFKTFKKLTSQNSISEDLTCRINNYIEESSKMKRHFNLEQDQQLMNELPPNLRVTYLREANKKILNKLVFFRTLLDRTLCSFAEKLETKISHPQEIIRSIDDDFNLIILRKGHIGFICKKKECPFNNYIADQVRIQDRDPPFLTSLGFVSKIRPTYEIQSLRFSLLYTLNYETFIQTFRSSDMDYELYCFLRDKCRNIPDEFEVYNCEYCKTYNHYKFTCPRLHFVPYAQHVINKELYRQRAGKNGRIHIARKKNLSFAPLEFYQKMKSYQGSCGNERTVASQSLSQTGYSYPEQSGLSQPSTKANQHITSSYLQSLIDEKTKEGIQMEFLKKDYRESYIDRIWNLSLDEMANYNSYFHLDNPKFLHNKFNLDDRLARKTEQANAATSRDETVHSGKPKSGTIPQLVPQLS